MSMMSQAKPPESPEEKIVRDVAEVFRVTVPQIRAKTRGIYAVSDARFAAYKLLYDTGLSLQQVGQFLKRDHGAVLHGIRKFNERRKIEKKMAAKAKELRYRGYKL